TLCLHVDMKSTTWPIGTVAEHLGMPTHVLRHWESVGLLTPERDGGGRRRYSRADVVRIGIVRRSQAAGMSLEQIRHLLDSGAPGRHRVLTTHLADLDRRMEEMRLSREMTLHAFECEAHDITACPNFNRWVADLLADF